ncbi:uncharacterized protein LOC134655287 [Cydia amplana]|uniref:uncharacterized protein LOC134655287 n=1 Tax=Cydia amplana TaxID=1869771 RepID=UPI002FE6C0B5
MAIGKLEVFNVESDSWSTYVERLEQYFVVNETKEEHKVPTLITVMGNQAYELLVTLCTPDKPASKKFAELVKVMSGHLQPKPSLLAERYRFRNRKQKTGESVADFVAELKKLAKHCVFGTQLTESLRDQLVCGLCDETIRQRLFTEDNISFDRALQVAVAMEAAQTNAAAVVEGRAKGLEGSPSTSSGCHAVSEQSWRGRRAMTSYRATNNKETRPGNSAPQPSGSRRQDQAPRGWRRNEQTAPRTSSGPECSVCGRPHDSSSCKFANYVCRVCNQPGHLKKMCPRYREVFAEGLGRYTGGEVSLRVREGARPVFLRARPLAYALREPVERALEQLERDGVITPVDSSDWATPIVPVVKTDGTIRELHVGHLGIVKMKAVARSYVWWPGIDADIEACCAGCHTCAAEAPAPPRAPVMPWEYPGEVVSDNGPPFTSREVDTFMRYYGITHTFTPAYHPASNGAAETAVKLCKRALKKAVRDQVDVEEALQEYLMAYRNTPHSTTGQTPAMLLQKRALRCRLDMLRPGRGLEQRVEAAQERQVQQAGGTDRAFRIGDLVWFRDYSSGEKWLKGKVDSLIGSRTVLVVKENDLSTRFKRHVDQVRARSPVSALAWPGPMDHPGITQPPIPPVPPSVQRPRRNLPPVDHYVAVYPNTSLTPPIPTIFRIFGLSLGTSMVEFWLRSGIHVTS